MTRTLGHSRLQIISEIRKRTGEGAEAWRARLRALVSWPVAVAIVFWLAAVAIVLDGRDQMPWFVGQRLTNPVFSRVQFSLVDRGRTAEERKLAEQNVPNHFRLNHALLTAIEGRLADLYASVKAAGDFDTFAKGANKVWPLDREAFEGLKALTSEAGSARFKQDREQVMTRLRQRPMVAQADVAREVRSTAGVVVLDSGDGHTQTVPKEKLTYAVNVDDVDDLARDAVDGLFNAAVRPTLSALIAKSIAPGPTPDPGSVQPIFLYAEDATKARIEAAVAALVPARDTYDAGDVLVRPGVIDAEALALLREENDTYLQLRRTDPILRSHWRRETAGLVGLILIITVGLAGYSYRSRPKAVTRLSRAAALAGLLLAMLALDRYALAGIGASPVWGVAAVTMTGAILTITYSQSFALGSAVALTLLMVLMHRPTASFLLIPLSGAVVAILLLREIRTRLRMVEVGALTALAAGGAACLVGFTEGQDLRLLLRETAFAALAAMAGISMVLVLLPVIERVFRITTNLTLLEWADTSRPLLRQLIQTAPGTWQHSHLIGSMAETAAEEIGANGLLVRVGAYYHDIGKMCKPNYFVENQSERINAHRNLAPTMSLLVILAHVKDGLALAKENRLPPVLHQFIAEHHGTTLVRYFHAMAAQEARLRGGDDQEVRETEFRYPGPRPRSRESAILMMCDGVEGAVRSLQDPAPSRIEAVVHDIVMDRLMDGQFDDCEITMKELSRVEQSLVRSLRAIYHGRIAYPTEPEETPPQARSA